MHFLTKAESGREEQMMRDWMDVLVTESGLLKFHILLLFLCLCNGKFAFVTKLNHLLRFAGRPTVHQPTSPVGGADDGGVVELLSQDRPVLQPSPVKGRGTE